jgi:hypothetical protein
LALLVLLTVLAGVWLILPNRSSFEPPFLSGEVADAHGPIRGACVRYQTDLEGVTTDASGRFRLTRRLDGSARLVASKEGYFITGLPVFPAPLSFRLARLPAVDHEDYEWVDPVPDSTKTQNCGNCHAEIYREWSASGHANSVTNRRFQNLLDGSDWHGRPAVSWNLFADNPNGAGVCTACHAPTLTSFNDPAYTDLRQARGIAARGVHCDYCHKVADVNRVPNDPDEGIGRTHGRFGLKLLRPKEGQLFFGPLDDVDRGEDAFSPLYRDSRYCASCHEGTVLGVHVYSTYSEWLASPARQQGKQCQTCHMTPTGEMTNIAPGHGGLERDPSTLANHRFFDGSQLAMLRRCLKVSVNLNRVQTGVHVEVTVRASDVGHRVPTGFVDRNLVLVVEPRGRDGRTLSLREGPALPPAAGQGLAGLPGKIYAKLLQDLNGLTPAPFWLAQNEPIDTRLLPGQEDVAGFTFPEGVDRVRVRLLYRRFWPEVARAKRWPPSEETVIDRTVLVDSGK